jgi:DivIVA protein
LPSAALMYDAGREPGRHIMFVRKRTHRALQDEHARMARALEQAKTFLAHYKAQERDVLEAIVSAQAEGRRLRAEAEAEAQTIVARARDEAAAARAGALAQVAAAERELARLRDIQRDLSVSLEAVGPAPSTPQDRLSRGDPPVTPGRSALLDAGAASRPAAAPAADGARRAPERHPMNQPVSGEPLAAGIGASPAIDVATRPARQAAVVAVVLVLALSVGAAAVWLSVRAQPAGTSTGAAAAAHVPAPVVARDPMPAPAATAGSVAASSRLRPVNPPGQRRAPVERSQANPTPSAAGRAAPATTPAAQADRAVVREQSAEARVPDVSPVPPAAASTSSPLPPIDTEPAVGTVASLPPVAAAPEAAPLPDAAAGQAPPRRTPEEDVLLRHREYFKALMGRDTAAMRRLTADGFSATVPFLESGSPDRPLRMDRESVEVRGVGAVVSGTAVESPAGQDGGPVGDATWLFSEVWINRDGQWLLLNVRFAKPPAGR